MLSQIWDAIHDGSIYSSPSLLASFSILSFADLKKYRFHYWFAFPALHSIPPWAPQETIMPGTPNLSQIGDQGTSAGRSLSHIENSTLVDAVQMWSHGVDECQRGFFLARKSWSSQHGVVATQEANRTLSHTPSGAEPPVGRFFWKIAPLSAFEDGFFDGAPFEDCYVCFADPSNYARGPGWMLRNLLVLVKRRWNLDTVQILRYRDMQPLQSHGRSIVMTLISQPQAPATQRDGQIQMPKVTGWERNLAGRLAGRVVNLTEYLDPKRYSHLL